MTLFAAIISRRFIAVVLSTSVASRAIAFSPMAFLRILSLFNNPLVLVWFSMYTAASAPISSSL